MSMRTPRRNVNIVQSVRDSSPKRAGAERKLAQFGLGLLLALQEEQMTIEEAEADLFNMDSYRNIRRFRYSKDLAEFILWGMELADVAELSPDGLAESYRKMKQLIRRVLAASRRTARNCSVHTTTVSATAR